MSEENNSTDILNDPYKDSELHPTYLLGYRSFDITDSNIEGNYKTNQEDKKNIIEIINCIEENRFLDLSPGVLDDYYTESNRENDVQDFSNINSSSNYNSFKSIADRIENNKTEILKKLNNELSLYIELSEQESEFYLKACMNEYRYLPGNQKSECDQGCDSCPSDGERCHCGFNAWFSPFDMNEYNGLINGTIIGTGKTQLHSRGFRSEYAQVVSLCNNGNLDGIFPGSGRKTLREGGQILSEYYGVPFFEHKEDMVDYNKENFPDAFDYRGMDKVERANEESIFDQKQSYGRTIVSTGSMLSLPQYLTHTLPPSFHPSGTPSFQSEPNSITIAKKMKGIKEALEEEENDEV